MMSMRINDIIKICGTQAKIGAEVGVWQGNLSKKLLNNMPNLFLYMIDSWQVINSLDAAYSDTMMQIQSQDTFDDIYNGIKKDFIELQDRVEIKRLKSVEAAKLFNDEFFDFVFIDAEHSYVAVQQDVGCWWPKVKYNGWLCGDDYNHINFPGVKLAVDEFSTAVKAEVISRGKCWFIQRLNNKIATQ